VREAFALFRVTWLGHARDRGLVLAMAASLPVALVLAFGPPATAPADRVALARNAFTGAAAAFGALLLLVTCARGPHGTRARDPLEGAPVPPGARVLGTFLARAALAAVLAAALVAADEAVGRALGAPALRRAELPEPAWDGPTMRARGASWGVGGATRLRLAGVTSGRGEGRLLFLRTRGQLARQLPVRVGWEGGGAAHEVAVESGFPFSFDAGPRASGGPGALLVEVPLEGVWFRTEPWAFRLDAGAAPLGFSGHFLLLLAPLLALAALTSAAARFLAPPVAALLGVWFLFQSATAATARDLAAEAAERPPARTVDFGRVGPFHGAVLRLLSRTAPDAAARAPLLDLRHEARACPAGVALRASAPFLLWTAGALLVGACPAWRRRRR
jgi:hypothetical protein